MSVSVKVSADVSGFEGGMAKAANAMGRLVESEKKLERSIKGLAMDLTSVSSPADLITKAFFRMENAMAVSASGAVAIAAAMYVFNDWKKYAANIDGVTKALEGMQKARAQSRMSQGDKEVAAAREQQGKLGQFGPGAVVMEGLSRMGYGESPVEKEVELYKGLQKEIKNAVAEEDNRKRAAVDTVKREMARLEIVSKQGEQAGAQFDLVVKIQEAHYAGNTLLAQQLTKLMDMKKAYFEINEQKQRGLELDKNMANMVKEYFDYRKKTEDLAKSNIDRVYNNEAKRLPILDQIERKTKQLEELKSKMDGQSGLEKQQTFAEFINKQEELQSLIDSAKQSSSVTTSRSSLIADSLARVGGGGGVYQSGPQSTFTKISSNTDQLVRLVNKINERLFVDTVTYAQ